MMIETIKICAKFAVYGLLTCSCNNGDLETKNTVKHDGKLKDTLTGDAVFVDSSGRLYSPNNIPSTNKDTLISVKVFEFTDSK